MSTGDRIPLAVALAAAKTIAGMWGLREPACVLVGSTRRGNATVGDLEFIAPRPAEGEPDVLFDTMDRTMRTEGLFGSGSMPVAMPIKGFKRGFGFCDVLVAVRAGESEQTGDGGDLTIAVQIHRYEADHSNRGWIEIMRTGPDSFGRFFLGRWKEAHGIPLGTGGKASVDGHLVDRWGKRVPCLTEAEAFAKCGLPLVPPERRAEFAEGRR